jgi:hypothetical protein
MIVRFCGLTFCDWRYKQAYSGKKFQGDIPLNNTPVRDFKQTLIALFIQFHPLFEPMPVYKHIKS